MEKENNIFLLFIENHVITTSNIAIKYGWDLKLEIKWMDNS